MTYCFRRALRRHEATSVALTLLALLGIPHITVARSDYVPEPLIHILAYDDHLLNPYAVAPSLEENPTVYLWSKDIPRSKLIITYDLQEKEISYIHDENLPDMIPAFTENSHHIFAGGDGLAVFDKKTGTWERWSEFDGDTIYDIVANDSIIWLGSNRGAIQVRLSDRAVVKRYSKASGLNSDKVYSLLVAKDLLLVGTFRHGRDIEDINLERLWDIFGLGLTEIDLRSDGLTRIELPEWEVPGPVKGPLVIRMYPLGAKENTAKIVTWKPWETRCWDYNYKTKVFAQSENQFYQLDRVLNLYQVEESSPLAGHLIDYIVTLGLDNWGGGNFETMKMIYDRGDFQLTERLLKDEDPMIRGQAVRGLSPIDDPRITKYFLEALGDKDSHVGGCATRALVERKEWRATGPLKNLLTTSDRSKLYNALGALVEFDDPVIKQIMVGDDDSLKFALGTTFSIRRGKRREYLARIVMAKDEPDSLRRAAISYIDGELGCRDCIWEAVRNKPLLTYLNSVVKDPDEDAVVRQHARSVIKKVKKRKK